jgi:hypothetical protein
MLAAMSGRLVFNSVETLNIRMPFARGWSELFTILLETGANGDKMNEVQGR